MPRENSEKADEGKLGRKLNSLEVLLLVFVSHGKATTYDLMINAGMSPGLTGPALKRMKAAGLLSTSSGARKVVRYALTKSGQRLLEHSLRTAGTHKWWLEPNTSFSENWPRSLFLIWLTGGFDAVATWTLWAEEELKKLRAKKRKEADSLIDDFESLTQEYKRDPNSCDKGSILTQAYRAMKANAEAEIVACQFQKFQRNHHVLLALDSMHIFNAGAATVGRTANGD
jgi:DNA-binding PadR family transcriptional regulator